MKIILSGRATSTCVFREGQNTEAYYRSEAGGRLLPLKGGGAIFK